LAIFDELNGTSAVTLAGFGLLTVALPVVFPQLRPAVKQAIKLGITLLTEANAEAEAELIESLVETTLSLIDQDLAAPPDDSPHPQAVLQRVHAFKRKAQARAQRWGADEPDRRRRYHRHVAALESAIAARGPTRHPRDRQIIETAFADLAEGI